MSDLIQLKRGPSSNIDRAKLKQGEPAFLYDTKTLVVGTGEENDPVLFLNERDLNILLNSIKNNFNNALDNQSLDLHTLLSNLENNFNSALSYQSIQIDDLEATKDTYETRIVALEKKNSEKIKSEQFSTAVDADKVGLKNLKIEVLNYIATHNGDGTSSEAPQLIPGAIGFDLLSKEVNEWIDNDYGSY